MRTWTDDQLIEAVKTSTTKAEVLRKIGLTLAGSYHMLSTHITRLNLNTSHFKSNKDILDYARSSKRKSLSLQELLVKDGYYYDSHLVKKRLLENKIFSYKCSECDLIEWKNKPLSLQLDHINGVHTDNRLENLRLLCPNCHSQTDNFSGRKTKKSVQNKFCNCGQKILLKSNMCKKCTNKLHKKKIEWPEISILISMINSSNFLQVGRQLGVSDNSIRKHLKRCGVDFRPRRRF